MSNYRYNRELRTERMLLKLTPSERKVIDQLQEKRQSVRIWQKVSKTDVIVAAVKFALGENADI